MLHKFIPDFHHVYILKPQIKNSWLYQHQNRHLLCLNKFNKQLIWQFQRDHFFSGSCLQVFLDWNDSSSENFIKIPFQCKLVPYSCTRNAVDFETLCQKTLFTSRELFQICGNAAKRFSLEILRWKLKNRRVNTDFNQFYPC